MSLYTTKKHLGGDLDKITGVIWNSENIFVVSGDAPVILLYNYKGDTIARVQLIDFPKLLKFRPILPNTGDHAEAIHLGCIVANQTLVCIKHDETTLQTDHKFRSKYGDICNFVWDFMGNMIVGFNTGFVIVASGSDGDRGKNRKRRQDCHLKSKVVQCNFEPIGVALNDTCIAAASKDRVLLFDLKHSPVQPSQGLTLSDGIVSTQINKDYLALCSPTGCLTVYKIDNLCPFDNQSEKLEEQSTDRVEPYLRFPARSPSDEDMKVTDFGLTKDFLIFCTDKGQLSHIGLAQGILINQFKHKCGIERLSTNRLGTRIAFIDKVNALYVYNPVADHLVKLNNDTLPTPTGLLWCQQPDAELDNCQLLIAYDQSNYIVFPYRLTCHLRCYQQPTVSDITASHLDESEAGLINPLGTYRLPHGRLLVTAFPGQLCCLPDRGGGSGGLSLHRMPSHDFLVHSQPNRPVSADGEDGNGFRSIKTEKCDVTSSSVSKLNPTELQSFFQQALQVDALADARLFTCQLDNSNNWRLLGNSALTMGNFHEATLAFRKLQSTGHLLAIERMRQFEDLSLLNGHIALLTNQFDKAQELFLASQKPTTAIDMRIDLLDWSIALQLAPKLDPERLPSICRQQAAELESSGDFVSALMYYERGLTSAQSVEAVKGSIYDFIGSLKQMPTTLWSSRLQHLTSSIDSTGQGHPRHMEACEAGLARNAIRLGDVKRGLKLARTSNDPVLKKESADLLDQVKYCSDAVDLYEASNNLDLAVTVCLRANRLDKAGELLDRLATTSSTSSSNNLHLHLRYARARELQGNYKQAAVGYESANEWDALVRLQLDKMNNIHEAVRIVTTRSCRDGAKLVAQYFIKKSEFDSAIKFLVLSHCFDAAFQIARKHKRMELYAELLGTSASCDEYQSIACYFEADKNWLLSGKYYLFAKQYDKAVHYLLKVPYQDDGPSVDYLVEAATSTSNPSLVQSVVAFLAGDSDGLVKHPRFLFRLRTQLKQYKEASQLAVLVASKEQLTGNYRASHRLLIDLIRELRRADVGVPSEMASSLALLHSYMLAKVHVKNDDHLLAAKMLIRVAESINKFPCHIVPILTSTVIECQKAGLINESIQYATQLLRSHRADLDDKFRRKFEALIRRRPVRPLGDGTGCTGDQQLDDAGSSSSLSRQGGEKASLQSPCPFCSSGQLTPVDLFCRQCTNWLPYCAISGYHLTTLDLSVCPCCKFPALYSELKRFIEHRPDPVCPMCDQLIDSTQVKQITDPIEADRLLKSWTATTSDPDEESDEQEASAVVKSDD